MKSIKAKLMLTIVSAFIFILVGALFALYVVQGVAKDLDNLINQELHSRQQVSLVLNQFKSQVQEWKNILIRGENPQQYEKYLASFKEKEQAVANITNGLIKSSYLPLSMLKQVKEFKVEHEKLGQLYREGLIAFKAANYNTQAGDRAVKGIDRAAVSLLADLNSSIDNLVNTKTNALIVKKETFITQSVVVLVVLAFVVILLLTFYIQKLIIKPVLSASKIADQIAKGNLANEIRVHSKDEIGKLLLNLDMMQENLNKMQNDLTQKMEYQRAQAQENGRIKQALDNATSPVMLANQDGAIIYANQQCQALFSQYQGVIGHTQDLMSLEVKQLFSGHEQLSTIQKGESQQVNCEAAFEHVIFNIIANPVLDDTGQSNGVVYELTDLTQQRQAESQIETIIQAAVAGKLASRLSTQGYSGFMLVLSSGINRMLDAIVSPIDQTRDYLNHIAKGNIPTFIDGSYKGDFLEIKQSLETSTNAIKELINDTNYLVDAASQGLLSKRADEEKHQGDFKKIIQGINSTLDSIIEPVQLTSHYLDDIAVGKLPQALSDKYQGDFLQIKTSLETSILAIQNMVQDSARLASAASQGDIQARANEQDHNGEFLAIVKGINSTLDAISAPLDECITVMHSLSEGNLSQQIQGDYKGQFNELKRSVNTSVSNLSDMVSKITSTTLTITGSSHSIRAGMNDLNTRTESQAASIEETTASMGEMTETVKVNSSNAHKANELAIVTDQQAQEGGELVNNTVKAMKEISNSSTEISNIIEVINEIAFQTNLLALNAAVEAARAGEKGRGFAVVAAEVRNLAQRSGNASKSIAGLLNDSSEKVQHGMELAAKSGKTLSDIVASIKNLASLMQDIASASSEQSSGIAQINSAVKEMDRIIQMNGELVENANSSSNSLSKDAEALKSLMNQFTV